MGSVKLKDLKAFVRYDGSGRVVSGSLVFRKKKPKNGRWGEITKNLCCNENPSSTTTTTTQGGGNTPTAFIQQYYINATNACFSTTDGDFVVYSASSTLSVGSTVFTDAALTTPLNAGYVIVGLQMGSTKYLVETGGVLVALECPFLFGISYASANGACTNAETYGFYTDGSTPSSGVTLYYNQALTQTANNIPYLSYNGFLFSTDGNGVMTYIADCSSITTTSTTTAAPVAYTFTLASSGSSNQSFACFNGFGGGTELVYATTNNGGAVTKFYTDSGLTTPFVGVGDAYLFQFGFPSGTNYAAFIDGSGNVTGNTAC